MSIRSHGIAAFVASLIVSSAFAQDIEPNQTKAEATANGTIAISAGGSITGTTTGTVITTGSTLITTVDTYRIRTGALPIGLYEHRLTLTSAVVGHTGTLRGLNQTGTTATGGTPGTVDSVIGTSSTATTPPRYNQWYGFGKQEEIYYRVAGTAATTAPYTATMSTTPITPVALPTQWDPTAPVTITTVGQTTVDTELMLFDCNWNVIGQHDGLTPTAQSTVTATLTPGDYYVAVSTFDLQSSVVSPPGEDFFSVLCDFPNCVTLTDSQLISQDWDFTVSGQVNGSPLTVPVTNTRPANTPYTPTWFRITVKSPTTTFCLGDGTGTIPCPCGNIGSQPGAGCATTGVPTGVTLSTSGVASDESVCPPGSDTLVLTATNTPGPTMFIQANGLSGTPPSLGDGPLCAIVGIIRLGLVFPTGGVASLPNAGLPTDIHVSGFAAAGQTKHYQAWYRSNPSICAPGVQNSGLTGGQTLVWVP